MSSRWSLWIDTGGTFTDCLGRDPDGGWHRAKVLSSGALRVCVVEVNGPAVRFESPWRIPAGFSTGAEWRGEGAASPTRIAAHPEPDRIVLETEVGARIGGFATIDFDLEAPILGARWITRTLAGEDLPPIDLRVATTRGTNALLERQGADVALFVTEGFRDLLRIGDQRRPDLFALDIRRPAPLWAEEFEVPGRVDARGEVVRALDPAPVRRAAERFVAAGIDAAAVALMHAWRVPEIEEEVAAILREAGFRHVSCSAGISPVLGFEARARTAVVDASLAPTIRHYLDRIEGALGSARRDGSLRVMTSAGGLAPAESYRACDSLLSGPAGGVVGAAASARVAGLDAIVAFDMGGTSTDVSRWSGDLEYTFQTRVGDAVVTAPALAIETVAAGGGSICRLEDGELRVGPRSAGATPGPACYGAGGPLTLTDVNLLLGRLVPERFGVPVDVGAAEERFGEIRAELAAQGRPATREELLAGFLRLADERMAEAVRRVSVRWGHDPRTHALVAFGGAGPQHACRVAELLGMRRVLLPPEAGLLSALGLGAAVLERFREAQVLRPLADVLEDLPRRVRALEREALEGLAADGVPDKERTVRRRMAFLRLAGQEATIEVEVDPARPERLERDFADAWVARYGYEPGDRPIELESLRVLASSRAGELPGVRISDGPPRAAAPRRAWFGGRWREAPTIDRADVGEEPRSGPALILDPHALLVVPDGWSVRATPGGGVLAEREG